MKILILTFLIILVACGKKTVEKEVIKEVEIIKEIEKIVDNTKTPVSTKTYGKNILVTFDDGSKTWIYSPDRNPITDLDAHTARVDLIFSKMPTTDGSTDYQWEILKYETLKGENWFIVKKTGTYRHDGSQYTDIQAVNMRFYTATGDWVTNLPLSDGEVEFNHVTQLTQDENGVYVGTETPAFYGYYNFITDLGQSGRFYGGYSASDSDNRYMSISRDPTPGVWGGGRYTTTYTPADINIESMIERDYFNFQEGSTSNKDIEKIGAEIEAMEVAEMEDTLVSYGLSNERAEKLGKLMNSYRKIKTKRALNSKEKDMFTKELTGMSFDEAATEMVEDYDGLIEKAAELNETSPEAIKELINTIM